MRWHPVDAPTLELVRHQLLPLVGSGVHQCQSIGEVASTACPWPGQNSLASRSMYVPFGPKADIVSSSTSPREETDVAWEPLSLGVALWLNPPSCEHCNMMPTARWIASRCVTRRRPARPRVRSFA